MRLISVFIVLFLLNTSVANACRCAFMSDESTSATVNKYDFIALVKVKKVRVYSFVTDSTSTQNDFAQIEIIELFKGNKVDSIHIWGIGTSCDMGINSGAEWLIYGNKNDYYYSTNSCTHSTKIYPDSWTTDVPFFLTRLYSLKEYFNHPFSKLKNGVYKTYFPDKQLKSHYIVKKNKINGQYYYRSNEPGLLYNFQFQNGTLHGYAYTIGLINKWISVSKYINGEITETTSYNITDSTGLIFDFTDRNAIDSSIKRQKAFQYHQLFLPDKSVLTKSYHRNNSINSIEHKDSTGQTLFAFRYSEEGKLEGQQVLDENTGISTYIAYYPSGAMERKIIQRPDRTQITYFYNSDGSIKSTRVN